MIDSKTQEKIHAGLAGVVAGDSAICLCGADDESLLYRGYSIEDLAAHSTFEEVFLLLLKGELPSQKEIRECLDFLKLQRDFSDILKKILEIIPPHSHPMDVLRTAISFFGNLEAVSEENNIYLLSQKLIALLPGMLLYWWNFHQKNKAIPLDTPEDSLAGHFLYLLHGKPPSLNDKRALDNALILYAEHEFNASTFTVRLIASTLSDYISSIVGGVGALRGPLHGGANEWAIALIEQSPNPDEAEKNILDMLGEKKLIMGFGHRVYKHGDPRSAIIKEWAKKLTESTDKVNLFKVAERIEQVMLREKGLFPNLDFYSALVFHSLGIPTPLFTPLFAIARTSGWSAHYIEQHKNNKLIRPLSHYTGPAHRTYISLEKRK